MPVRKIPKNYVCVTGSFASRKNRRMLWFESLLERDYMILLEFDHSVEGFEEQPVRIPVKVAGRRNVAYVPDLLVRYRPGGRIRKPRLAEIKTRKDLQKNAAKYKPKFSAAAAYANERKWQFCIVDEQEIRIPRLKNLKFLREYWLIDPAASDRTRVVDGIADLGGWVELPDLLERLCASDDERLLTLPIIWHLVATGDVVADLDQPFTDCTPLSLPTHRR